MPAPRSLSTGREPKWAEGPLSKVGRCPFAFAISFAVVMWLLLKLFFAVGAYHADFGDGAEVHSGYGELLFLHVVTHSHSVGSDVHQFARVRERACELPEGV